MPTMLTVLKGPCTYYSGMGKVFSGLASRLAGKLPLELQATNNDVPAGYPLPIVQIPRGKWFGVVIGHPPFLDQLSTRYRILYTMYEHSDIPLEWQEPVARANEVWVPSRFCYEVFRPYNPRTKIIPIGYDETAYRRVDWSAEDRGRFLWTQRPGLERAKWVVGTAGVQSKRKGIDVLVEAFKTADLPDSVLVIKTRDTRGNLPPLPSHSVVIDREWDDATMADFYRSLDVLAWPTRGEGFGLPPLEAAACGTPSFVTRASGPCEYIDDRGIYGIKTVGTRRSEGAAAANVFWHEPDSMDLVANLRRMVYDCPKVEHRYRDHSMAFAAERWESELLAAQRRAETWIRQH